MFKNNLKIAIRFLLRYKGYTAINIAGLTVGVTCCILILLFVRSEFSYDRHQSKADRIFRLWQHEKAEGQDFVNVVTPIPAGPALKARFPEVEATTRVYNFSGLIKNGSNSFSDNLTMVDPAFFTIFDVKWLNGEQKNPFPSMNSILITPAVATKYFGAGDATGKTMEIQVGDEKLLFSVSGIVEPQPEESSIKYDMLISYANAKYTFNPRMLTNWFNIFNETYLLLNSGNQYAGLEKKFPGFMKEQLGNDYGKEEFTLHLQPLTDIHLNNSLPSGLQPVSNPKYAYILGSIGFLILLVACINFIILSIGRSTARAMEVGVRKTMGAERKQLIFQFWGEAFLLTLFAVAAGLALTTILLKPFNVLVGRELSLHWDIYLVSGCILLTLLIALIAGIYPAIILSGFNPVRVLKGNLNLKSSGSFLRKGLIVAQFTASILMIISTLVIRQQLQFVEQHDIGYDKERVVIVQTNKSRKEGLAMAELYRNELLKQPRILGSGTAIFSMAETPWATLGFTDETKTYRHFAFNQVQPGFIETMKIQIIEGRSFDEHNPSDYNNAVLVNESFVKEYGLNNPVGKKLINYSQRIIGVMKDFNFESLHTTVKPLVFAMNGDTIMRQSQDVSFEQSPKPRISVRVKDSDVSGSIRTLGETWAGLFPGQHFEYSFLDETLANAYRQDKKSSTVVRIASALCVFIACLGLFGLATLSVTRRTKEIGVRKLLGANPLQLVQLISTEFILLVVLAAILAAPLAWYAMKNWLTDFAYRAPLSWWLFVMASVLAVFIALLTVSIQAIRAASANPVRSLRTE